MKIFRRKVDVDNLKDLLQRKQQLAEKLQTQRLELNQTLGDLKEDLTPARLLHYTLKSFARPNEPGLLRAIIENPAGIRLVTDFAINTLARNPRTARTLRALVPMLIQAIPAIAVVVKKVFRKKKKKKDGAEEEVVAPETGEAPGEIA